MLGRTDADEMAVRRGNWQREDAAEPKDVVSVLLGGRVAEVAKHLHRGRDARNRDSTHLSDDEALGRVAKGTTARLRLNPATLRVEGDGVEVELLAVAAEHEANRKMIFVQREAERPERFVDSHNIAERDDQIEVFVWPGFAPQQRVHAPTTVQGRTDSTRLKD